MLELNINEQLSNAYLDLHKFKNNYSRKYNLAVGEIEDAIGEAVFNVQRAINLGVYKDQGSLKVYLYNNFLFRVYDKLRVKKRLGIILNSDSALLFHSFDAHIASSIDNYLIISLLQNSRFSFLQALIDGEKPIEIAERLGKPRGTINPAIAKQKKEFKKLLEQYGL